jgi:hypothetical protein
VSMEPVTQSPVIAQRFTPVGPSPVLRLVPVVTSRSGSAGNWGTSQPQQPPRIYFIPRDLISKPSAPWLSDISNGSLSFTRADLGMKEFPDKNRGILTLHNRVYDLRI